MKHIYTLTKKDLGKAQIEVVICKHCGHKKRYSLFYLLGRVVTKDINKRIYLSKKGNLFIENQEQLKTRLKGGDKYG